MHCVPAITIAKLYDNLHALMDLKNTKTHRDLQTEKNVINVVLLHWCV